MTLTFLFFLEVVNFYPVQYGHNGGVHAQGGGNIPKPGLIKSEKIVHSIFLFLHWGLQNEQLQ